MPSFNASGAGRSASWEPKACSLDSQRTPVRGGLGYRRDRQMATGSILKMRHQIRSDAGDGAFPIVCSLGPGCGTSGTERDCGYALCVQHCRILTVNHPYGCVGRRFLDGMVGSQDHQGMTGNGQPEGRGQAGQLGVQVVYPFDRQVDVSFPADVVEQSRSTLVTGCGWLRLGPG